MAYFTHVTHRMVYSRAMAERYREVFSERDVDKAIIRVASDLTAAYSDPAPIQEQNPLFVQLLPGAQPFASRLMPEIVRQVPNYHPELDSMLIQRYAAGDIRSIAPEVTRDLSNTINLEGRPVVLVDNLFDYGVTAEFTRAYLLGLGARSVTLAILVQKNTPRETTICPDFVGLHAPNQYLIGMGMDDPLIAPEFGRWWPNIVTLDTPDELPKPIPVLF